MNSEKLSRNPIAEPVINITLVEKQCNISEYEIRDSDGVKAVCIETYQVS